MDNDEQMALEPEVHLDHESGFGESDNYNKATNV